MRSFIETWSNIVIGLLLAGIVGVVLGGVYQIGSITGHAAGVEEARSKYSGDYNRGVDDTLKTLHYRKCK